MMYMSYLSLFFVINIIVYLSLSMQCIDIVFLLLSILLPLTYDLFIRNRNHKYFKFLLMVNVSSVIYLFVIGPLSNVVVPYGFYHKDTLMFSNSTLILAFDGFLFPLIHHLYQEKTTNGESSILFRILYYVSSELFIIAFWIVFQ